MVLWVVLWCFVAQSARHRPELSSRRYANLRLLDSTYVRRQLFPGLFLGSQPLRFRTLRNTLRRMAPVEPRLPRAHHRGLGLEIGAVVMLTVGSLIPVLGWAVGVVLLWSSGRWRPSEKLLGTLIVPGGPGMALLLGAAAMALPSALTIPVLLFTLIGPVVMGVFLLNRARGRAALERHKAT